MYMHPYAFPYAIVQPGTVGESPIDAGACSMAKNAGEATGRVGGDPVSSFNSWYVASNIPTSASLEDLRNCYMQGYQEGQAKLQGKFYQTSDGKAGLLYGAIAGAVVGVLGTFLVGRLVNPTSAPMYRSLADAAKVTGDPRYGRGGTKIWFAPDDYPNDYRFGSDFLREIGKMPTRSSVPKTHKLVGRVSETDPDRIYAMMQGEAWSPQGRARDMIRAIGSEHTSMSVGDVAQVGDRFYMVDRFGFKELQ